MPRYKKLAAGQPASYYYTPPSSAPAQVQPALTVHKKLEDMAIEEAVSYQEQLIARTKKMRAGMQRYLDYRAKGGRHTSTDDIYQDNVVLIDELLAMMQEVLEGLQLKASTLP